MIFQFFFTSMCNIWHLRVFLTLFLGTENSLLHAKDFCDLATFRYHLLPLCGNKLRHKCGHHTASAAGGVKEKFLKIITHFNKRDSNGNGNGGRSSALCSGFAFLGEENWMWFSWCGTEPQPPRGVGSGLCNSKWMKLLLEAVWTSACVYVLNVEKLSD